MAHFSQTPKGKWRAFVSRKGYPRITRVWRLKADAVAWATELEARIEGGATFKWQMLRRLTISHVIERYREDVVGRSKNWKQGCARCNSLMAEPWAAMSLDDPHIALAISDWRDSRLKQVKPGTVLRDLKMLNAAFNFVARRDRLLPPGGNPIERVEKPRVRDERNLMWCPDDVRAFLDHVKFDPTKAPTTIGSYMGWVVLILLYTGLRLGETVKIKTHKIDLHRRCIHLEGLTRKNGWDHEQSLSAKATEVIGALARYREGHELLFPTTAGTMSTYLRLARLQLAKTRPHMAKLRTHDLRHTATTNMVPKFPNMATLMKATGRRSARSLDRYYHPRAEEIARLLDQATSEDDVRWESLFVRQKPPVGGEG